MDKKTIRFFRRSVISIFIVCIAVFICLSIFMGVKTEQAIKSTTNIYMSEMNQQIQQKFTTMINLRIQQLDGIISVTPPEKAVYNTELIKDLSDNAKLRNFSYLGLYAHGGDHQKIFGSRINLVREKDIQEIIHSEQKDIITEAKDPSGNKILIIGRKAEYPMEGGVKSEALLAGIPMEDLSSVLFLSEDDSLLYYHIVDKDGQFVIRSGDAFRENYFDRILARFDALDGKTPQDYVDGLADAMSRREAYSAVASMDGQQIHLYCSPLSENSGWYLIAVMPNNVLMKSISDLDKVRTGVMFSSAAVILLAMSVIFVLYYRLSQRQMRELVTARNEADHSNAAKSNFLSSMSHEIRTPMNAIIGMTEIAQRNIQDPKRVDDCLNKVRLSSKHLLGLINDVLDMSKIESKKMSLNVVPVSLRDTMDDIVNIVQPQIKEKKMHFDIFIKDIQTENLYCDDVRLSQVLLNILSNAIKYTPPEGTVHIFVNQEPSTSGENYVRTNFSVADTGIGMSPEFQEKIWDTFSRENTNHVQHIIGTGLGMSITKSLVDLMGGTITLESEVGKGTTFHLSLDLKKAEAVSEDDMQLPPWNILVVDDDEQLCSSAVSNLSALGINGEWAMSGEAALQKIQERREAGGDYDFVLVDWKMPGMDGIQTIDMIRRQIGTDIRLFLISADDWSEVEDKVKEASIEDFISKPLFVSTLYEHLRKYVDGYQIQEVNENAKEITFEGKRILIAEDMEINWEIANEILSASGLVLERAENGKECLEMFQNSQNGYYDAILMDIRMPVMDGYTAAKAVRALNRPDKNLPIIAMTADAFEGDVQKCMENGMDAHIPKPLDVNACLHILQSFLG